MRILTKRQSAIIAAASARVDAAKEEFARIVVAAGIEEGERVQAMPDGLLAFVPAEVAALPAPVAVPAPTNGASHGEAEAQA